jgi:hypothetical protein
VRVHTLTPRQKQIATKRLAEIEQLQQQNAAANAQLWELLYALVPDEVTEGLALNADTEEWFLEIKEEVAASVSLQETGGEREVPSIGKGADKRKGTRREA